MDYFAANDNDEFVEYCVRWYGVKAELSPAAFAHGLEIDSGRGHCRLAAGVAAVANDKR